MNEGKLTHGNQEPGILTLMLIFHHEGVVALHLGGIFLLNINKLQD
jgi:hypothetical protein